MIIELKKGFIGHNLVAKFPKMRKEQEFVIYPMSSEDKTITLQSDNRFGQIRLTDGLCIISQPKEYANSIKLRQDILNKKASIFKLSSEDLQKVNDYVGAKIDKKGYEILIGG